MAIEYFRSLNMEDNVVELEKKIVANAISCDCDITMLKGEYFIKTTDLFLFPLDDPNQTIEIDCNYKCAIHLGDSAIDAFKKQYYHLAIFYAEQSFEMQKSLGNLTLIINVSRRCLLVRVTTNWETTLPLMSGCIVLSNVSTRL